jgi:hypothetical protein
MVPVAIETGRGLVVSCLVATGRDVVVINPMAAARYRERTTVARSKSDTIDALMQANVLHTDRPPGLRPRTWCTTSSLVSGVASRLVRPSGDPSSALVLEGGDAMAASNGVDECVWVVGRAARCGEPGSAAGDGQAVRRNR